MSKTRYSQSAWWLLCHLRDLLITNPRRRTFPPVHSFEKRRTTAVRRLIDAGILTLVREDDSPRAGFFGQPLKPCVRVHYTTTPTKIRTAIASGTLR